VLFRSIICSPRVTGVCSRHGLQYGNDAYFQNELLTVYFHRSKEDYQDAPYPPMVSLSKLYDQNYVPLVPGQMLQIASQVSTTSVDDLQSKGDRCLFFDSQDRLTKNGKYWAYRYECVRVP